LEFVSTRCFPCFLGGLPRGLLGGLLGKAGRSSRCFRLSQQEVCSVMGSCMALNWNELRILSPSSPSPASAPALPWLFASSSPPLLPPSIPDSAAPAADPHLGAQHLLFPLLCIADTLHTHGNMCDPISCL